MPETMYDYRPELPTREIADECYICENKIYVGDEYYKILGRVVCEDCIEAFKEQAEE